MWYNLERPIARLIRTVDRHLKAGVCGVITCIFNLNSYHI